MKNMIFSCDNIIYFLLIFCGKTFVMLVYSFFLIMAFFIKKIIIDLVFL